jgi:hypothetical protein
MNLCHTGNVGNDGSFLATAFVRQPRHGQRRRDSKPRRHKDTNIIHEPVFQNTLSNEQRRDLHARVNAGSYRSSERIPDFVIEPRDGRSKVEIRVEFMNDASKLLNGVQTNSIGFLTDTVQDLAKYKRRQWRRRRSARRCGRQLSGRRRRHGVRLCCLLLELLE